MHLHDFSYTWKQPGHAIARELARVGPETRVFLDLSACTAAYDLDPRQMDGGKITTIRPCRPARRLSLPTPVPQTVT
ncbi:hypothetical protein [Paracidovorax avenae]|uniref:hypothetical protein n=1 Tax=Paracidovorax avenae TaxID=80867 RepID=UPI00186508B1|nr:hypothetical protein [Paracidovorax avenae]